MKKLTKYEKNCLKQARALILEFSERQEIQYQSCLTVLNTKDENSWLFDYLFGNGGSLKQLEEKL